MSLQVWLPFTKDISNQGLSSVVSINGGATIDTSGKLGSCYSFTGSNYVALPTVILPSKTANWSFSCWFYLADITTTTAECLFSERTGTNYNGYSIFLYPNNGKMLIDDGVRWTVTPMTFAATTWYHLVITRSPQGKALYINGELKASTTTVGNTTAINTNGCLIGLGQNNSTLTAGGQGFKGKLNDVRIYDHTLSIKEIKELAKGLVLHYPLKDLGIALTNKNLLPDSNVNAVTKFCGIAARYYESTNQTSYTATWENITDPPVPGIQYGVRYVVTAEEGFHGVTWYSGNTISVTAEPYTLSCYAKRVNGTDLKLKFQYGKSPYISSTVPIINDDEWHQYSWTFIPNTASGGAAASGTTRIYGGGLLTPGEIIVCGWKLEKGTIVTPWTECGNEIFDVSGLGHNGTTMGAMTNPTTNFRYGSTVHFTATSQHIIIPDLPTTGFSDSYTFAWWGTRSSNSTMFWGFGNGIKLNGMYNGRLWNTGDGSDNPLYKPNTTTQVAAPATNTWHHWAMVGNGTDCRVYCNGVLFGIAKTYKSISGSIIYLNGWNSLTNYSSNNMSISDFRIYSTALSAEDILELYKTSASIDNKGNGYAREVIEDDDNLSLNKKGQFYLNELIDDDVNTTASITKANKELKVNTFYEY